MNKVKGGRDLSKIGDLLQQSEIRTDILRIAFSLEDDALYTKEEAIQALLDVLDRNDL